MKFNTNPVTSLILLGSLIFILLIGYPSIRYMSSETVDITVTDKERIVEGNGESTTSKYLVFTEQEAFENTDEIIFFKFNSTDYQRRLVRGEEYTVRVAGWRVPFLSMYRNIVSIESE